MMIRKAAFAAFLCVSGVCVGNGHALAQATAPQESTSYYEVPARSAAIVQQPGDFQPPALQSPISQAAQAGDKWAAVAVSNHPGKDAYGFQYIKDSAEGAMADARAACEARFAKYGIPNGQCVVRSSRQYVIGLYCRISPNGRYGFVGEGATPKDAATDALKQAAEAGDSGCDFKVIRHATIDKAAFVASWSASIACNGQTVTQSATGGPSENSAAIQALNRSFARCGGQPRSCQVAAYAGPQ